MLVEYFQRVHLAAQIPNFGRRYRGRFKSARPRTVDEGECIRFAARFV